MVFFPGGRFWFLGNRKQCPARKAINNELNSGCLLLVFAMLFCKPFLTSFAFNWPFCHTGMTETLHFLWKRPFVSQPLTDLPIYSPFKFCQHMSLTELVVKQISPSFFSLLQFHFLKSVMSCPCSLKNYATTIQRSGNEKMQKLQKHIVLSKKYSSFCWYELWKAGIQYTAKRDGLKIGTLI